MANNCVSEIAFYSEDKEQLEEMCKTFQTILKEQMNTDEWDYGFIGDYVKHYFPNVDINSVDCAGVIVDVLDVAEVRNSPYYSFWIFTDTKWDAKIGVFKRIVDEFYPNIKIAYSAYELLGRYLLRWDESGLFCLDKYYVGGTVTLADGTDVNPISLFHPLDESEDAFPAGIESKEQVYKILSGYLFLDIDNSMSLEEASEWINERLQGDDEIILAEFEEVPPEEFAFYVE